MIIDQPAERLSGGPWLAMLKRHSIIAIIRATQVETGLQMAQAVARGGIRLIEITWDSHNPVDLLRAVQQALPHCYVGVGTVLTVDQLMVAIATGAHFCFSPYTSIPMIRHAQSAHLPIIPGALTPTEIITAWNAGATGIKVFPIISLGGAQYIRALQGPMGHIPLIPTGGVDVSLAPELLAAGAAAVGLSSALFPQVDIEQNNWPQITQRTQALMANCH